MTVNKKVILGALLFSLLAGLVDCGAAINAHGETIVKDNALSGQSSRAQKPEDGDSREVEVRLDSVGTFEQAVSLGTLEALVLYLQKYSHGPQSDKARNMLGMADEEFYRAAVTEDNAAVYQYFLDHYAESEHLSEVSDRLMSLQAAQHAIDLNSSAAYRQYFTEFPAGYHVDLMRKKIAGHELDAYTSAIREDTAKAYHNYLVEFQDGLHTTEIENRYASLTFLQLAKAENRVEPLLQYLEEFPAGFHEAKASAQIEELEFDFFSKVDTAWGYDYFLKKYPATHFKDRVAALRERAAFVLAEKRGDPATYKRFLDQYPDGNCAITARKKVRADEESRNDYETAVQAGTEKAFAAFLKANPESPLRVEARNKLAARMLEQQLAGGFNPLPRVFHTDACITCPSATLLFKNPLEGKVTLVLTGPAGVTTDFQAGEGGQIRTVSGKYRLALIAGTSQDMKWSGEIDLAGEYLVFLDEARKDLRLIGLQQPRKRKTRSMNEQDRKIYDEQITHMISSRNEILKTVFPIRADVTPEQLKYSVNFENISKIHKILPLISQLDQEWLEVEVKEMLGDRESMSTALQYATETEPNLLWPLLGLLKMNNDRVSGFPQVDSDDSWITNEKSQLLESVAGLGKGATEGVLQAIAYADRLTRLDLMTILAEIAGPEHENIFLRAFDEPNYFLKSIAAHWFREHPSEKALLPLIDLIYRDHFTTSQGDAFIALNKMSFSGEDVPILDRENFRKALIAYESCLPSHFRSSSPFFLSQMPKRMVEKSLFAMIESDDSLGRKFLCDILAKDMDKEGLPLLGSCIQVSDPTTLERVLEAFNTHASPGMEKTFQALLERGRELRLDALQSHAVHALADMGTIESVQILSNMLSADINRKIHPVIARELGGSGSPEALQVLLAHFRDEYIENGVAEGLAKNGSDQALKVLLQRAFDPQNKGNFSCCSALHNANQGMVLKNILKMLNDSTGREKYNFLQFISKLEVAEAAEILVQALNDGDLDIRRNMPQLIYNHDVETMKHEEPIHLIQAITENNIPKDAIEAILAFFKEKKIQQASEEVKKIFLADLANGEINIQAMRTLNTFGENGVLRQAADPVMAKLSQYEGGRSLGGLLEALVLTGDERVAPFLIEWSAGHEDLSVIVVEHLGRTGDKQAVPFIIALYENILTSKKKYKGPSSAYKKLEILIESLGNIQDISSFHFLEKLFHDKMIQQWDDLFRITFLSICKLDLPEKDVFLVKEFDRLKKTYSEATSPSLSSALASVKSVIVVDDLVRIVHSGSKEASSKAFLVLTGILRENHAKIDLAKVASQLGSTFFTFNREKVVYWLESMGNKSLESLDEWARRDELPSEYSSYVIQAYGRIGRMEAIVPLLRIYDKRAGYCQKNGENCASDIRDVAEKALVRIIITNYPELSVPDLSPYELITRLLVQEGRS